MTTLVYDSTTGEAVSIGTTAADPLPPNRTAITLTTPDADGLHDGSRCWNPSTRAVEPTPGWVDPAIAEGNRTTIEAAITAALTQLDTLIASPATPVPAAIPTIPAGTALTATQLTTALRALSAWANTNVIAQRDAAQATRAGAQQVAATLKRTIRLVRGDFTGTN